MNLPTKIPTLAGLMLLVLFVGGFVVVFERIVKIPTVATSSIAPKHVEITNISDAGFSVSWTTETPATGSLVVSKNGKNQVVFDERDASGKLSSYLTHNMQYRAAGADTEYSVKILSNGKTFLTDGKAYSVRTGPTLSGSSSGLEPAYGTVVTSTDQPAIGALVYLTVEGGQKLSTLVTASGSWLIPLNLVRTAGFAEYAPAAERITEELFIRSGTEDASAITDSLNDSPVPEIRLGKTYDFRHQQADNDSTLASQPPNVLGQTTAQSANAKVTITKPIEGAALPTTLPLFQGTGIPGNLVSIVLGITHPVGGSTTVATDGIWRYTPTKLLSPGKQTVTITTNDANRQPVAMTRSFEILKAGTQVLGVATPSATLTPTLSASASPTPTSTLAGVPPPQSGTTLPIILLVVLGLGLLTSGAVIFVK